MKIYTRTGDEGETGLFTGRRVLKNSSYLEAYGNVDELNSWIGLSLVSISQPTLRDQLLQIQHDLHVVCADLATPLDASAKIERVKSDRAERLEKLIDQMEKDLQPLTQFILAGGSEAAARLHIARTVCRRSERGIVAHFHQEKGNPEVVVYINRLSDYLFVAARWINAKSNFADVVWDKAR